MEQANAVIRGLKEAGEIADTTAKVETADSSAAQAATDSPALLAKLDSTAVVDTAAVQAQDTAAFEAQFPLFAKLHPMVDEQGQIYGGPVIGRAMSFDTAAVNRYMQLPQVKALLPRDIKLFWGVKSADPAGTVYDLYAIKANTRDGKAPLDGGVVTEAREEYSQHGAAAEVRW